MHLYHVMVGPQQVRLRRAWLPDWEAAGASCCCLTSLPIFPAERWRVAVAHIALPAALAVHSLPVAPPEKRKLDAPWGFQLAWGLDAALDEGGSANWSSVHAWAAWLLCANAKSIVVSARQQLLRTLSNGSDSELQDGWRPTQTRCATGIAPRF